MEPLDRYRGRKILVAMSGGVDSALAAVLLKRAGADVVGVHMRVWHYDDCSDDLNGKIGTCCAPSDANDARRVAERFDFPFHAMDFQADFRRAVIDPFVADYRAGRTPNPCVNCNNRLKLGTLLARAAAYGCDAVATGHYARTDRDPATGRARLLRAVDREKDQSYYLFGLTQAQLARLELPLGSTTKPEVRALARELGLHVADKPDSQDICFVADGDYRRFLRDEAGLDAADLEGAIVDTAGRVLGRHRGIHEFTVGQRKGLGIAHPHPLYVVDLLPETRTVVVGSADETFSAGLDLERLNWVGLEPTVGVELPVRAKIRYRHEPVEATLFAGADGTARVDFVEPQRAVSPGQAAVLYDAATGEVVAAGGWIARRVPLAAEETASVADAFRR